jgi:hypothetical protein
VTPQFLATLSHGLVTQALPALSRGAHALLAHFRGTANWIARHTGIPAVFVAALLIVISWRMAKRMAHVAVEVAVVTILLLALTKLGVVSW